MIRYRSQNQISIEEFQTPFQLKLDSQNQWVKLSRILPWDKLATIYYQAMSTVQGKPGIDARRIIGEMMPIQIKLLKNKAS